MPKGNPNSGDKKVNGILKVYDPVAKAYRPSYIAPDATSTVQGDVLLSDSVTSTDDAATGITAATPKAVKEVNDNANTKLSKTETAEQTIAGPVVFGDSLTVEGESIFNEKVTFDKGIAIPGGVTLEGNVTGNADTATKLKTAVNINTKSGAQTASTQVSFDGSKDITLPLGDIDASAIKGVLSLDNIPQSAIERVVNYESLDAAFNDYLAAANDNKPFQSGDTIRVPDAEGDTAEMYAIVGDPAVKNNYVKYAASVAAEALEAEHAQVADKINIADIADGSAMCVIDKVLKKSGATVGGEYKPMYLHNGTFEETTFTIKTNVPADAKFTDTTYTDFTPATEAEDGTIERGQAGLVPAPTTKDAKFLKNDGTWADVPSNWDELADKPLSYNGTIQDVGIENGKFYVEALFTSIGQVEFETQLQILSTAGNQLKLTSAIYEPQADGTSSYKFVIEPPTGQIIADMKIVSAGLYYNSTTLLDEWKPEQIQSKYPGASGSITVVENQEKVTATGQAQTYTVNATVSGNDTQIFKIGVIVSGAEYLSDPITPTKEGLSYLTFSVAQPPNEGVQGDKVTQVILYCGVDNTLYTLDRWYPQTQVETLYLNNGKIVKVANAFNDNTKYTVDYVINTNYDYTKYHLQAWYDIPGWNDDGMSSPEFVTYDVRAGSKNVIHGTTLVPKTKTQDSGSGTLELVSIELYEQATTGNDIVLDIWKKEVAEVEIDNSTITKNSDGKIQVNGFGVIGKYWNTGSGLNLRTNPLYFKESSAESDGNWPDTNLMLDLNVDNKTLKATSDLPLQVWTRPVVYGGSGLASTSTWFNSNTSQEETVNGLYVNPGLGLMINQENEITLNPQNTPYIIMRDLNWGDTPNGRGINYTVEGLIPRVHEEDSGNFGLGIAVIITQPGNVDYKWTKFYTGNFDKTDHCYHVNAPAVSSGFVGLDSNGGDNAWFSGIYDSNKPINIEIFAADVDDPNQGTFITFNGLNKQYLNISDPSQTSKTPSYFTASYDCYAVEDNIATNQQIIFRTIGWLETNIVEEEPISLKVFNIDGKVLTTPIVVKSYSFTPGTYDGPVRSVFGTPSDGGNNNGVLAIEETDLTANSITSAPSEYILVVATDKNNKELWAQKIDMPLTYLDPADAAQLVQDALATTTS